MHRIRLTLLALGLVLRAAAQPDLSLVVSGRSATATLAVPDFRGDAQSQPLMRVFNDTLWRDLDDSAVFRLAPKSQYPLTVPQQPSELRMQEWSAPPAQATYLAMGYSAVQTGSFLFRGWLMDLRGATVAGAQAFEKIYGTSPDQAGARLAAHRFAADILANFGVKSLFGTHIYFVRESSKAPRRRTEIWMMDFDGANQRQITHLDSNSTQPAISPDGSKLAFISYAPFPAVLLYSTSSLRPLPFANPREATSVASPSFSPDGQHVLYSSQDKRICCQIWIADLDGSHARAITSSNSNNVEARINPKNNTQLAFVSGRSGHQQIYAMDINGVDVNRISSGEGEASNPSWHSNGQFLAYAATRGYGSNGWNIFVQNVAGGQPKQLTHDEGKNENPVWAPDGMHLVFMSNRSGTSQIWTMLADGTELRQLTHQGVNGTPVWGP